MKLKTGYKEATIIRRISMQNIPNFAFTDTIIKVNKTLLDNDHIKKRIENIPVRGIYFNRKDFESFIDDNEELIQNNATESVVKNAPKLKMICYKKYDNSNSSILQDVTTDDCKFFLNEKEIKNPYNNPFKIVDLGHNKNKEEEIEFSSQTSVNIPIKSSIFAIIETPIYKPNYIKNIQDISFNARDPAVSDEDIVYYCKSIFKKKIDFITTKIKKIKDKKIILEFNNDQYTFPFYLSYILNNNEYIDKAYPYVKNMQDKTGYLQIELKENIKITLEDILSEFGRTNNIMDI